MFDKDNLINNGLGLFLLFAPFTPLLMPGMSQEVWMEHAVGFSLAGYGLVAFIAGVRVGKHLERDSGGESEC